MKIIESFALVTALLLGCALQAQVAITTDGSTADNSAMLEVKSTTKGFLPPRMTQAERLAIPSPAAGLIVYQTDVPKGLFQHNGTDWVAVGGTGLASGTQAGQMLYWDGSDWVVIPPGASGEILIYLNNKPMWGMIGMVDGDVYNAATGKIWMDRNLGASQVATSMNDAAAFGDLYQWGRGTDGHQLRTSATTTTLSNSDDPGHGDLIVPNLEPWDWRFPQNGNLWQGVNGTNNPCPEGYRLPTEAEWTAEKQSWSSSSGLAAFASPLKLPLAGYRQFGTVLTGLSMYWSSTTFGQYSQCLFMVQDNAIMENFNRGGFGLSVRCIKD